MRFMEAKAEGEYGRSVVGEYGELVYLLAFKSDYTEMILPCKSISHILYT